MLNEIIKAIILLLTLISLILMLIEWMFKKIFQLGCWVWAIIQANFAQKYQAYYDQYGSKDFRPLGIPFFWRKAKVETLDLDDLLPDEVTPNLELPNWETLMKQQLRTNLYTPEWQLQIRQELSGYLEQNYKNYKLIVKVQSLPPDWKNQTARKLKRFCVECNQIIPKTITGHASKGTNKRHLIDKISKLQNKLVGC